MSDNTITIRTGRVRQGPNKGQLTQGTYMRLAEAMCRAAGGVIKLADYAAECRRRWGIDPAHPDRNVPAGYPYWLGGWEAFEKYEHIQKRDKHIVLIDPGTPKEWREYVRGRGWKDNNPPAMPPPIPLPPPPKPKSFTMRLAV